MSVSSVELLRQQWQQQQQRGQWQAAEQSGLRLLALSPGELAVMRFLAARHYARGEWEAARQWLRQSLALAPQEAECWHELGAVEMAAGELAQASHALQQAVRLHPDHFVARLRLGLSLQQQGEEAAAGFQYLRAINLAQARGRWLSDDTTAEGLREAVQHAMAFLQQRRGLLFSQALEPLRQRYGAQALVRVEQALAIYLGTQPRQLPDPRQHPRFLYFPGIPSQPYYPRQRFPWYETLEAAAGAIGEELAVVLRQPAQLEPFLGSNQDEAAAQLLRQSQGHGPAAWDAYFFYRHGERFDAHLAACPRTAQALAQLPLVKIRDHAPETLFSVLTPGSHILPHSGVTNTRLVTHLPLIVPEDCALRVGGEDHHWQEGRCITFDDTFVHEAWNRSARTRVVMILDCWNPDLTEVECLAVTDLVEAIGDFNRSAETV